MNNFSKIQNYSPADSAKTNDRPITSRKLNRRFNPRQIINYMVKCERQSQGEYDEDDLKRSLVQEYLEVVFI